MNFENNLASPNIALNSTHDNIVCTNPPSNGLCGSQPDTPLGQINVYAENSSPRSPSQSAPHHHMCQYVDYREAGSIYTSAARSSALYGKGKLTLNHPDRCSVVITSVDEW